MPKDWDGMRYLDERGWEYEVKSNTSGTKFKAHYLKRSETTYMKETTWKSVKYFPWRDTPEEAQADLDQRAQERGWVEW